MISLIERPEPWSFSRNPIRYKFSGGIPIELQVRLYVGTMDGNPANDKLINSYSLTPTPEGITECYVENDIDALLRWQMPDPQTATITPVTSQTISFFTEFREIFTLGTNPTWQTDIANRRFAFKGGLPMQLFNRSLPTQFSKFTYQSTRSFVSVLDHFYRTFVSLSSQQASSRSAEINILFSDNTTQSSNIAFPDLLHNIYHVPASPAAWGLVLPPSKTPVSYQVLVRETINGVDGSQIVSDCVIDHNWYREANAVQYHNSLGGLDYVRLLGDTDIETERSVTDGEAILGADYNQPAKPGQYFQRNISFQQTYKSDVGWFDSPADQEVMLELDLSQSAWILKPLTNAVNQWVPIRILNKSRKLRSVSSKRWNYEVEWQYAFNISAYSNLKMAGLGVDTNTYTPAVCGLVSIVGLTAYPQPNYSSIYIRFEWTTGQNAWQYQLRYRELGTTAWITITTSATNVLMQFFPNHTYEWEVRSMCTVTDVSPWVHSQVNVIV